jgi:uncharacterized protein
METTINISHKSTNKDLLLPYLAPYLAYVAIASTLENQLTHEWSYAVRLLAVPALLAWSWKRYAPLVGPRNPVMSVMFGLSAGLLGTVLWILLLYPFALEGAAPWSDTAFWLRFVSAGLVIPICEELLMRGYALRLAFQWDMARRAGIKEPFERAYYEQSINQVAPGSWSVLAVAISTIIFVSGHHIREWPAATVYGLLMAMLWIVRKDLLSCVVAHSATNICLALYVRTTGHWSLW